MSDVNMQPSDRVLVGVSSCLLGNKVRFDGGHKRTRFLVDQLGEQVRFLPVCPEVELGMGTPRETIRLQRSGDGVRLVAPASEIDYTDPMQELVRKRVRGLEQAGICGFVLKSKSPTCGMERVRLYGENGIPTKIGVGLFAAELKRRMPTLPVEEEGRLNDPGLRGIFVRRVFAYSRVRDFFDSDWTPGDLVQFQQREKLMLKVHDPVAARRLGAIVAASRSSNRVETREAYFPLFMETLGKRISRGAHDSMLQRILGGLRRSIQDREHSQIMKVISDYRKGFVSLDVPRALIQHYVRLQGVRYLSEQTYFQPCPASLTAVAATEGAF